MTQKDFHRVSAAPVGVIKHATNLFHLRTQRIIIAIGMKTENNNVDSMTILF